MQVPLFEPAPQRLQLEENAWLRVLPGFVPAEQTLALFDALHRELPWQQTAIRMFGKRVLQPRLTAWVGDAEAVYVYSGLRHVPTPWTKTTARLRDMLLHRLDVRCNSVLGNLYRDGRDAMGWHADNEPELGPTPTIVSLSLGATRRFVLRHNHDPARKHAFLLHAGDALVMAGTVQTHWKHAILRERGPCAPRINLTFRHVTPRTSMR